MGRGKWDHVQDGSGCCLLYTSETEAAAWFDSEEILAEKRALEYFLDMRYKGQNHEIRVPLDMKEVKDSGAIAEAFIKAYERLYSRCV